VQHLYRSVAMRPVHVPEIQMMRATFNENRHHTLTHIVRYLTHTESYMIA